MVVTRCFYVLVCSAVQVVALPVPLCIDFSRIMICSSYSCCVAVPHDSRKLVCARFTICCANADWDAIDGTRCQNEQRAAAAQNAYVYWETGSPVPIQPHILSQRNIVTKCAQTCVAVGPVKRERAAMLIFGVSRKMFVSVQYIVCRQW